jgi:hypothetical protein
MRGLNFKMPIVETAIYILLMISVITFLAAVVLNEMVWAFFYGIICLVFWATILEMKKG